MLSLLKTDLKRALKDKLFIVLLIIAAAFAILTPILYKTIFTVLKVDEELLLYLEKLGFAINAKSMFFDSFSLSNNFGLMLPIFVAIILCRDFSNGTIRNKVICGKSRASIYFSLLITCTVLICSFILFHAVITLLVALLLFDYQATPFTINDFGYLMASIGIEILVYVLICTILTFFIVLMRNAGLTIVMFFVVSFAMIILGGIIETTIIFADTSKFSYKILEFLYASNVFTTKIIGTGVEYNLKELIYLIMPTLAFVTLFILLGLVTFKKKDLK